MLWQTRHGDSIYGAHAMKPESVHGVVTDPPYRVLEKRWDTGVAFRHETWAAYRRVTMKGGHLAAFGHHTTAHRMVTAIEGYGYPKGPGQLKPLHEPIVIARNPFDGSEAGHFEKTGLGRLFTGVDGSDDRCPGTVIYSHGPGCLPAGLIKARGDNRALSHHPYERGTRPGGFVDTGAPVGDPRPNGTLHAPKMITTWDCEPGCPVADLTGRVGADERDAGCWDLEPADESGLYGAGLSSGTKLRTDRPLALVEQMVAEGVDRASAVREVLDPVRRVRYNDHATVKPLAVCRWLVRLLAAPGMTLLDPFMGSGSLGIAATMLGCRWIGYDTDQRSVDIAQRRIAYWLGRNELGDIIDRAHLPRPVGEMEIRRSTPGSVQLTLGDIGDGD